MELSKWWWITNSVVVTFYPPPPGAANRLMSKSFTWIHALELDEFIFLNCNVLYLCYLFFWCKIRIMCYKQGCRFNSLKSRPTISERLVKIIIDPRRGDIIIDEKNV